RGQVDRRVRLRDDPDPGVDGFRALLRLPAAGGASARYRETDMTSGKKARTQRRAPAPPPVRSTGGGRRASPKVLAAVAGAIALAAVAAALAFALTGGSSPSTPTTAAGTLPDA